MNIGQFIQKIKDMILEAKAGHYAAAVMIALELLAAVRNSMPEAAFNVPPPVHSYGLVLQSAAEEELVSELGKHIAVADTGDSQPVSGPLVAILIPIILALLKKWLSS